MRKINGYPKKIMELVLLLCTAVYCSVTFLKVKSKISYLGERNSILPGQMAEQLAVEVDVKNVTEQYGGGGAGQAPLFCLD